MKTLTLCSLLAAALIAPVFGAENWHTDYDAAKKLAAKQNKDLLIDFTGSDWCGWCIKLREEVFSQEAFKKGTADHFVLVELDYPRDKSTLAEETQAQNEKLKKQFGIRGYPTIFLCDAKGRPYARTGYQAGGPENYVKHLDELRAKRNERDKVFAGLKNAKGQERATGLEKALALVPQASLPTFYKREFSELAKLNPKSALVREVQAAAAEQKVQDEFRSLFKEENFDGVLQKADELLATANPQGEARQKVLLYKMNALMATDKFKAALALTNEVEKAAPESRYGKGMQNYRKHIEEIQKMKSGAAGKDAAKPQDAATNKESVKATKLVPAKKKAPKPQKPAAKPMASKEAPKTKAETTRRGAEKQARENNHSRLSEEQLKKALEDAKHKLAKSLEQHTRTEKDWQKAQASLQDLRSQAEALEQQLAKLKKAIGHTEKNAAALNEQHEATHRAEATSKKAIEALEKELARRALIAQLEKEAAELQRKAEELRKRAEQLRR